MSQADVEIARSAWEDFAAAAAARGGDALRAAAARWWADDVVYREDPKWPGAETVHGRHAVTERFLGYADFLGDEIDAVVEEVRDAGEEIVAVISFRGRSTGGGVPWERTWAYVVCIRDGRIASFSAYFDVDEGLRAAGLEP